MADTVYRSLTDWQIHSINGATFNLSDGHAHHGFPVEWTQLLTPRLGPTLFSTDVGGQNELEQRFSSAFLRLAGQTTADTFELSLHYAASVSTDCVARSLVDLGARRVGLITPTFDNIPLLLRRAGLDLVALEEYRFWTDPTYRADRLARCDVLYLVVPNNPTGFEPSRAAFLDVVADAAARGALLVVDFSFRFYSHLHEWDQYAAIAERFPSLDAVFVEDTGKTWPISELKIGFTSAMGRLRQPIRTATREILLNVSPFTLSVLTELIGTDALRREQSATAPHSCHVVANNRATLRRMLAELPITAEAVDTQVSVEWLRLPTGGSTDTCTWLERQGVGVLPGNLFYWDHSGDDSYIRVALARTPEYFQDACARLAELLAARFANDSVPVAAMST